MNDWLINWLMNWLRNWLIKPLAIENLSGETFQLGSIESLEMCIHLQLREPRVLPPDNLTERFCRHARKQKRFASLTAVRTPET
ncbi:MAG TPA: hypothetical protein VMM56_03740 [Planctomycetaceae bacterium]|nr:hypothetical protein [Planctomycetaceae bacterium]